MWFPFRPFGLIRQGTHPVTGGGVFEDTRPCHPYVSLQHTFAKLPVKLVLHVHIGGCFNG